MRILSLAIVFLAAGLAGCTGGDDDTTPSTTASATPTTTTTTTTTAPANITTALTFSASPTSGDAPLAVQFAASLSDTNETGPSQPHNGSFTWALLYGDGTDASGDEADFPADSSHEYGTANNYTATLTVTLESGAVLEASQNITVELGEEPTEPPQLVFEFGPSLGCVTEAEACVGVALAQNAGEFVSGIDGHWIPLDERYWGLGFTSDSDHPLGDTDCLIFDDAVAQIGEGNNGGGPCQGQVPNNAAWLYFFPWAAPATASTVTFA
jgi:hypothetical protein